MEFDESVSIWQKSRGKKYLRSFRMRTEMMTRRKMMTKMRRRMRKMRLRWGPQAEFWLLSNGTRRKRGETRSSQWLKKISFSISSKNGFTFVRVCDCGRVEGQKETKRKATRNRWRRIHFISNRLSFYMGKVHTFKWQKYCHYSPISALHSCHISKFGKQNPCRFLRKQ